MAAMTLAEAIRDEIDRRAISQDEAADLIGVAQQTISRWATGDLVPSPDALPGLARFLHRPVSELKELRAAARQERRPRSLTNRLEKIEQRLSRIESAIREGR